MIFDSKLLIDIFFIQKFSFKNDFETYSEAMLISGASKQISSLGILYCVWVNWTDFLPSDPGFIRFLEIPALSGIRKFLATAL